MKRQIIVNGAVVLEDVKRNEGAETRCYFGKIRFCNSRPIHITYDCLTGNLIIHEWYNVPEDVLGVVTELIFACIKKIIEEEIFKRAVIAMDRYTKALEMGFPEKFIDDCDDEMSKDLQEIKEAGLMEKFMDFCI